MVGRRFTVLLDLGLFSGAKMVVSGSVFNSYEPGSKLLVLGMVIQPLIGNPYNGYINPYYCVDDHPQLYGNIGSLDPSTYACILVQGLPAQPPIGWVIIVFSTKHKGADPVCTDPYTLGGWWGWGTWKRGASTVYIYISYMLYIFIHHILLTCFVKVFLHFHPSR